MPDPGDLRAGIVGLGVVGRGVAQCLLRSGHLAAVHVRRQESAAPFRHAVPSVPSPADLADLCDVVLIAVRDAAQTLAVLDGPDGLLARPRPGLAIALLATVSLRDLAGIRTLTDAAGVMLVDCGVIGVAKAADNGIVCLVGGEDAAVARVQPVLAGFAQDVVRFGGPGAGMAAKLARNVITYTAWRGAFEAATLAGAAGVDIEKLAAAIDSTGTLPGGATTWLRPFDAALNRRSLTEAAFGMLRKDLAGALELADDLGLDLPTARLTQESASTILGLE